MTISPSGNHASTVESIELVPPRANTLDSLAIETLLGALNIESVFSLEIAGDERGRHFLIRAEKNQIEYLQAQLQSAYDQIAFREVLPDQDPAREDSKLVRVTAQLTLRRPVYLPLRTYRDGEFRESDPMRGILGAFMNFQANERALVQLVLCPAPPNWAEPYLGSIRQIEQNFGGQPANYATSPQTQMRMMGFMGVLALCLCIGLQTFTLVRQSNILAAFAWGVLGFGILVAGIAVVWFLLQQPRVDPELVKQKISRPAYDVALRLVASASTRERAEQRIQQLASAYRQFHLSNGNSFVLKCVAFDPRDLSFGFHTWYQAWFGYAMRLNTTELASLWHLPYGDGTPLVERTLTKRLLPLREQVSQGAHIGYAVHQGENIPVHLAPEAFQRHMLLVAKTQKGKSTLMGNLAIAAMDDTTRALTVIDPHGDLVRALLAHVQQGRANDVVYLDFGDPHLMPGLNVLDVAQGRSPDKIVSNFIHVGALIWQDYWGPRMEDALRIALLTLLAANQALHARGDAQFTLLDVPALFQREGLLKRVRPFFETDRVLCDWWDLYWKPLYPSLKLDIANPVMTKINRFATHRLLRNILGQSSSTVDFGAVFAQHKILLVNTAAGVIGSDAAGLLGAVILDALNVAVREQASLPDASRRARGTVIVDEFQSIPGVDYAAFLAELQKMGANFILATQALRQLDKLDPALTATVLSNADTLFVFQTSAEDARVLARELDEAVEPVDIINLPAHSCYVKTQRGKERLPVMHVETLPIAQGAPRMTEQILQGMLRYTRSMDQVERDRAAFQDIWYTDLAAQGEKKIDADAAQATNAHPAAQTAQQDNAQLANATQQRKTQRSKKFDKVLPYETDAA